MKTENTSYVHGYSEREAFRLKDQSAALESIIHNDLESIIHNDSIFKSGNLVLEAGCGVGAQTKIIAAKNPDSYFISVDISEESLKEAKDTVDAMGITNVEFQQADIFSLPFDDETFDSVFVCFVLEHLHNPKYALNELKRVLKKGGSIMIIEGDHGSTFFYPDSEFAHLAINCQVRLQKQSGGNSNIGRELYPLLQSAGFLNIFVSPRMVYVDAGKPQLVDGFIKNTFTAMIEGVRENAVNQGILDYFTFDKGIKDLYRTTESDGVFSYTFFKGFAVKE